MMWDSAVGDALEALGDDDFFTALPPSAADHGGLSALSATWTSRYSEAVVHWWHINDTIFDLLANSLDLHGQHFERDFLKVQSFKKDILSGRRNALGLYRWINSHYAAPDSWPTRQSTRKHGSCMPWLTRRAY